MGSLIQSTFNEPELLTGGAVGIEDSIFTATLFVAYWYHTFLSGKTRS